MTSRHRDHAVRVGPEAAEEPQVLDQHPVRQAQNTTVAITAGRTARGRPSEKPPPRASAATANRFTANPRAALKSPKPPATRTGTRAGGFPPSTGPCGQGARLAWTCPARSRVPARPARSAIPTKNSPVPRSTPGRGRAVPSTAPAARSARRRPVRRTAPGAPKSQVRPGQDPAKGLAEDPHHQAPGHAGQPREPATRPRSAPTARCPIPTWIHTSRGGRDRVVVPGRPEPSHHVQHPAREPPAEADHLHVSPPAIDGWACSSPSNSQRARSRSAAAAASRAPPARAARARGPAARPAASGSRMATHTMDSTAKISKAMSPWGEQQRRLERRHHHRVVEVQPGIHPRHARHRPSRSTRSRPARHPGNSPYGPPISPGATGGSTTRRRMSSRITAAACRPLAGTLQAGTKAAYSTPCIKVPPAHPGTRLALAASAAAVSGTGSPGEVPR